MHGLYQATILQMCFFCCCSLNKQKQKFYDNTFSGKSVALLLMKGLSEKFMSLIVKKKKVFVDHIALFVYPELNKHQ